jgi:hypothetical protein
VLSCPDSTGYGKERLIKMIMNTVRMKPAISDLKGIGIRAEDSFRDRLLIA